MQNIEQNATGQQNEVVIFRSQVHQKRLPEWILDETLILLGLFLVFFSFLLWNRNLFLVVVRMNRQLLF